MKVFIISYSDIVSVVSTVRPSHMTRSAYNVEYPIQMRDWFGTSKRLKTDGRQLARSSCSMWGYGSCGTCGSTITASWSNPPRRSTCTYSDMDTTPHIGDSGSKRLYSRQGQRVIFAQALAYYAALVLRNHYYTTLSTIIFRISLVSTIRSSI